MARIIAEDVLAIMDNDLTIEQVDPFVLAAHDHIDRVFAGTTYDEDYKKAMELWFAAHLVACTLDRTTAEEKIGDAGVVYAGKWGKGLEATQYGQTLMQLDTSGLMARAALKQARITAINQVDIDE